MAHVKCYLALQIAFALCNIAACTGLALPRPLSRFLGEQQPGDAAGGGLDLFERLLSTPSRVYGPIEKRGTVPLSRYDSDAFDFEPFRHWLRNSSGLLTTGPEGRGSGSRGSGRTPIPKERAPLAYPCAVFVSHYYRLIWVSACAPREEELRRMGVGGVG